MENKVKNVLSGIGFYGTLAVCLLVVGVCGWVLLQDREDPLPQQAVTPQVPVSQPVAGRYHSDRRRRRRVSHR